MRSSPRPSQCLLRDLYVHGHQGCLVTLVSPTLCLLVISGSKLGHPNLWCCCSWHHGQLASAFTGPRVFNPNKWPGGSNSWRSRETMFQVVTIGHTTQMSRALRGWESGGHQAGCIQLSHSGWSLERSAYSRCLGSTALRTERRWRTGLCHSAALRKPATTQTGRMERIHSPGAAQCFLSVYRPACLWASVCKDAVDGCKPDLERILFP